MGYRKFFRGGFSNWGEGGALRALANTSVVTDIRRVPFKIYLRHKKAHICGLNYINLILVS